MLRKIDLLGYVSYLIVFIVRFCLVQGLQEYCLLKLFNATCHLNEVIVMNEAKYGRLRSGGCLGDAEPESLGCYQDVLPLMDRICSGKRHCAYEVGREGLYDMKPCGATFAYSLEADYDCIQVAPHNHACGTDIIRLTDAQGYISSSLIRNTECMKPIHIQAYTGQIINITLMDFADVSPEKCRPRGWLSDVSLKNNISICPHEKRESLLYKSSGNVILVNLYPRHLWADPDADPEFIIHYKVLGCMDLIPPPNGWYERAGDKAVVGCKHKNIKWHIKCVNNLWQGVVGKCYKQDTDSEKRKQEEIQNEQDQLMLLLVIILVAMVLVISTCGFIIVLIKCRRLDASRRRAKLNSIPVLIAPSSTHASQNINNMSANALNNAVNT